MSNTFLRSIRKYLEGFRDIIFPYNCIVCGHRMSGQDGHVCVACQASLPYTNFKAFPNNPVERLFFEEVQVERANSYLFYNPGSQSRRVLFALKYEQMPSVGLAFGKQMARELLEVHFFEGVDALIPVPLAKKRLHHRGYNQSEIIAKGVSEVTELPIWDNVVERVVENPTQTHLSRAERKHNVENIFECKHPEQLKGKWVVIIDDVVTTGATISSCIKSMAGIEGIKFSVLTLALASDSTMLPNQVLPDFDL